MTSKRTRGRPKKTTRIYYGRDEDGEPLFWTVPVIDAKKSVKINGTLAHAMAGVAGHTIGCHLSKCCKANAAAFPHPVKYPAFTQTRAIIVTEVKNGRPSKAIRYSHSYGELVHLNDTDKQKRYLRDHPEIAERSFTLSPPRKDVARPQKVKPRPRGVYTDEKRAIVPRGALRRAVEAGFVSPGVLDSAV